MKQKDDIIVLTNTEGVLTSDKEVIVNMFADHFATVYGNIDLSKENMPNSPESQGCSDGQLDNFVISEEMVLSELKRLPIKETLAPDGIPPVVFNRCAEALVTPITHLLKMSLSTGKIPDVWRHILVSPIHKKGSKKIASNYRPIGLVCILCKVCERIVRSQLTCFLQARGIVSDKQHGFRTGRSTITSLLITQLEWKELLRSNAEVFVAYLDFSKAFDVVDHNILKGKLYQAGLRGNAIKWMSDYLYRRTMSVVLDDHESSPKDVCSGVIQGSALCPALFSFFSDDLPLCVADGTDIGLFADDVKLYFGEKQNLETSVSHIVSWSRLNALPLASKKNCIH
jgi:hypothetical protein